MPSRSRSASSTGDAPWTLKRKVQIFNLHRGFEITMSHVVSKADLVGTIAHDSRTYGCR